MSADVLLLAVMVAALYLLVIAPLRNRSKRAAEIKEHLRPGAELMTTSGLFGTVTAVDDEQFHLEVSPGVSVRFALGAVGKIIVPKDSETASDDNKDQPGDGKHDGGDPPTKTL